MRLFVEQSMLVTAAHSVLLRQKIAPELPNN